MQLKDILQLVVQGLNTYQDFVNAKYKKYENIKHLMRNDYEILIPFTNEVYIFNRDVWDMHRNKDAVVMTKKKKIDESKKIKNY